MKILGNILWLIFGGLNIAIEYFIASFLLMITIIGIPFGIANLRLGILALWPFGSHIIDDGQGTGCINMFMNVLWFFIGGIWIALTHLFLGRHPLHHHRRHTMGTNALPSYAPRSVTIRQENCQ